MKLGSLRKGGRDGTLIVVDRDLGRAVAVPHIAPTLIGALERWHEAAPELEKVAADLAAGIAAGAFALDVAALASPLPRSPQFLDGSVYLRHMEKARAARGAAMPPDYDTVPIMYQGLSDRFVGPAEPMVLPDDDLELDYEAEIAVVVDDVPMGVSAEAAAAHITLVMLLNDYTLRALTRTELPRGFGFLQAKPTSSFSPVAVTLDELAGDWDGARFHLRVRSGVNGRELGHPDAGEGMYFTYPQLIAHAARTRSLSAGTIIGAGSISNESPEAGFGCIAEARIAEGLTGEANTPWLRFGDEVWIDATGGSGLSVFGEIRQRLVRNGDES